MFPNSVISSQTYHFFKLFHRIFLNFCAPSLVYPADSQFYPHLFGQMGVDSGSLNARMTQKRLYKPQICAGLQQMGGKCMPKGTNSGFFLQPGRFHRPAHHIGNALSTVRLPFILAFKYIETAFIQLPVREQCGHHRIWKHGHAVHFTLIRTYVNFVYVKKNIFSIQIYEFAVSQNGSTVHHHHHPVLWIFYLIKNGNILLLCNHNRKPVLLLWPGQIKLKMRNQQNFTVV